MDNSEFWRKVIIHLCFHSFFSSCRWIRGTPSFISCVNICKETFHSVCTVCIIQIPYAVYSKLPHTFNTQIIAANKPPTITTVGIVTANVMVAVDGNCELVVERLSNLPVLLFNPCMTVVFPLMVYQTTLRKIL